ncbi:MAG: carbonic anhydrase [Thermoanaerobaculia bacterium]
MQKRPIFLTLLTTLFLAASPVLASATEGMAPELALAKLTRGNARAVSGKLQRPHQTTQRRKELGTGQQPFAVIVSCSDSRVPPELVFDQGLGDLFVVRVAGEVCDDTALGSIEYAVEHLGARLVVVLGHERCGAVKAALDGGEFPPHIAALVTAIKPSVEKVAGMEGDPLDNAVRANVERVVEQIRPNVKEKATVVGMVYDLDTGVTR